jgi:hypothetical protein
VRRRTFRPNSFSAARFIPKCDLPRTRFVLNYVSISGVAVEVIESQVALVVATLMGHDPPIRHLNRKRWGLMQIRSAPFDYRSGIVSEVS